MATEIEILQMVTLKQGEALYQLSQELGLTRLDLEILAFSEKRMFFTLYDLQRFYSHTNVPQIRRSLQKLSAEKFIQVFSKGGQKQTNELCNAKIRQTGVKAICNNCIVRIGLRLN